MALMEALFLSVLYTAAVGLDIVLFFLLVRFVIPHWSPGIIRRMDTVGRPLVDGLIDSLVARFPARPGACTYQWQRLLCSLAFASLWFLRLVLAALLR